MKNKLLKTLSIVGLLLLFVQSFAQAPPLGTAADFALFSSVGAVGNTGTSQITGNVGTNSGAITGFGNVNGVMHTSNGATAQCAADLLIAYNQLNSTIPNFFPAPLLGNGQILGEGVYSIAGSATLSNELTLDAQNDSDAVFIFQINGAFSTAALSSVTLINGAQACNVFWKIEGLVDMASGTTMRGTIIANNGAINMNADGVLEGRALSTAGAVNVTEVFAYTPIGCGSPVLMGPDAPNLVTAECYAVFSSNGAVSNAGITYVVGDVGTNVGATTGFNPLFVTGEVHTIPDGSTAAAASDLLNAYNFLNVLPYDIELLYPAQFGNDLVLTPHTYLMNSATTFNGDLYLNAGGQEDAVFVIQINGALTTGTFANVILMDGTKPENVFWKVDGAVAINDYSNFVGTIIANNGAVEVNTGVNLEGRVFTTTGALSVASATITMPPGCDCVPIYWTGKTEGDLISNVEIPGTTLANNSGTDPVNPAYTYFTGQTNYTADLVQGGSYNLSISVGTQGDQHIRAWIDYNDDGEFDHSEAIGSTIVAPGAGDTGPFSPAIFNVNLSNSAPLGTHKMRIRSVRSTTDNLHLTLDACAAYEWGETEDYDVTIIAPVMTQLQAGSCGATDVAPNQLLFATNVNAPQYRFRFTGDNNGGPGWNNDQFIVDRPHRYVYFNHLLPGFQFGENYNVEVAVGDGSGNFGPYGDACDVTLTGVIPTTQIQTSQCGATVDGNNLIFANQIFDAQGYRFKITGSNNGGAGWINDEFILDRPNRNFYLSWLVPGATPGATFSVEVAYLMNDGVTYSPYGAACNITLNPQTTQIQASQCGATGVMPNALVFANQVFDAQGYRFRITGANNGGTGWNDDVFILDRPNRNFNFQWGVPGSLAGETYEVEVAFLQNDGVTYSAYGAMCEITLFGSAEFVVNDDNEIFQDNKSMISVEFGANASHNPFTTDFGLQVLNANDTETINVNVYDMSGKLIERNAVNAMDIETVRFGANLAAGMYMIEVRQGSNQAVIRQVKN